ncbi:hypothetical protein ILYODFUR_032536 [Ilyodon furcidens]|uniref:Uncharacterized protein n=1 Tax=Ilyodon furcidens TaxID=33524 RepID=A0ABV0V8Q0_9TELE
MTNILAHPNLTQNNFAFQKHFCSWLQITFFLNGPNPQKFRKHYAPLQVSSVSLSFQQINQDLNIQLLKDGYRLDEIPDDEDLDLIPPKSVNPTCMCCQATSSTTCQIQ